MLHPHVPDDVKHFAKHLFATFLGLLMALGLESWREHHVEMKMAKEHLEHLDAEVGRNRRELEERLGQVESEKKALESSVQSFSKAVRDRRKGLSGAFPKRSHLNTPDLSFYWSAWDTAKSTGAIRNMEPGRLQRFSTAYTDMQRVQGILDQMVTTPAFQDLYLFGRRDLSELNLRELERLSYGLQFLVARQSEILRLGKGILAELKEAQQS